MNWSALKLKFRRHCSRMLLQQVRIGPHQQRTAGDNYYLFICYNVPLKNPKSWNYRVSEFTAMAKGHSYLWRKPGRRDEERRRFAALIRRVEKVRVREGLTKRALAAEIGASEEGLRAWISGRSGLGEALNSYIRSSLLMGSVK